MQAPVLLHPNFDWPFIVETNAFDTTIGGILFQYGDNSHLHLVLIATIRIHVTILDG